LPALSTICHWFLSLCKYERWQLARTNMNATGMV
jgi:hypothetical protein